MSVGGVSGEKFYFLSVSKFKYVSDISETRGVEQGGDYT